AGSGTVSTSTSTLNRSLSPSFPGTGGNGGNGGAAGIGGADGGSGEICTLICGDIPTGTSGGAGPSGNQGNAGDPGLVCSKLDGGVCTP
ncbi:MAG TPA: hypothetical protein VNC41_16050, partial [Acidimicrobiia bacterium]|nr:hypothetical protein [Acidimicrobiia bacterium]